LARGMSKEELHALDTLVPILINEEFKSKVVFKLSDESPEDGSGLGI